MTDFHPTRGQAAVLIVVGSLMTLSGIFWKSPDDILLTLIDIALLIVGMGIYLVGCAFWARAKGYEWFFGLLGTFSVIGLLFLLCLPVRDTAPAKPPGRDGYTLKRVSPMLAVEDMQVTLDFYTSLLGFAITLQTPEYSVVERDGASIHFMLAADESVLQCVRGHAEIYLEVDDIQPLWKHVKANHGKYKLRDLFDRPYGMTEFHLGDPNDCLVFVGQVTKKG